MPRPEYPRPQLRRQDWMNLNGEWSFAFDDSNIGLPRNWQNTQAGTLRSGVSPFDRRIIVPFCYQSKLSGIGETTFHDVVWYARTFEYPPSSDDRLLLHFGAVDYRATVWVNGAQVASHEGGHTPFFADITDALAGEAGENVVIVRAEDPSRDVTIPRGKQYWKEESEGIFYTRTTGIWQTVWLEPVNRQRIEKLRLTPNVENASIDLEANVVGVERDMSLRAMITFEGESVVEDTVRLHSSPIERSLSLLPRGDAPDTSHHSESPGAALWSPEVPNLYDLLLGRVDGDHPLYDHLSNNGFSDEDFAFFREHTTEPDILGINYYPHMSTTEFLPEGKSRTVWSGTGGIEELVRDFYARYGKPIFWTETSVPGTVEARVRWLEDSLALVHRLRAEGIPLVGYTWWPLFSLLDWAYREGEKPPEAYLWHMGMYDLESDGRGRFTRNETPVVGAFRAATGRTSER